MIVTDAFRQLLADLAEDGIPNPLTQEMPLFAVWSDLCRLAGEPEPAEVAALMDAPAATLPRTDPARFIPVPKPRTVRR